MHWSTKQTISGVIPALPFAEQTDKWVIAMYGPESVDIATVAGREPGVSLETIRSVDSRWDAARVVFDGAEVAASTPVPFAEYGEILRIGVDLVNMAMYGAAYRVLNDTVNYLQTRQQFGRSIGSFQALKHRMADLFIQLEHVGSLVYASIATDRDDERELWSHMAKIQMELTYRKTVEEAIQLHGGVGFTESLPLHHFLKNAWTNRWRTGDPILHREALKELLLEGAKRP